MAELTFKNRMLRVYPELLGNHASPDPFAVEAKRLSSADFALFRERAAAIRAELQGDGVAPETIAALFEGILEGPVGELVIDGEPATSLAPLFDLAAREYPFDGGVFAGLIGAVSAANSLSERASKNYERRRGGSGGTTTATTAASLPPSAAADAESNSSPASI